MKSIILATLIAIGFSGQAEAGCGMHLIEDAVRGKTYSAYNHPKFPTKLTFYPDGSAGLGSALDGHPGGRFTWRGLCSGNEVVLTFHPTLAGGPVRTALHLQCAEQYCRVLRDKISGWQFSLE